MPTFHKAVPDRNPSTTDDLGPNFAQCHGILPAQLCPQQEKVLNGQKASARGSGGL